MPEGFYNAPIKPDRASVNAPRGYDGNTYLHELCERGAPASYIQEAINMGADINALNRSKMPPLGLAIARGEVATVKAMLDAGAEMFFDVSEKGGEKKSFNATYLAAANGNKEKLAAVLEKGGDAYVNSPGIDSDGYDNKLKPLHAAIKKWKPEVVAQLVDAGAFVDEEAGASKETPLMMAIVNDSEETILRLVKRGASLEYKHSVTGDTPLCHACTLDKRWSGEKLLALGADALAVNNNKRTPLMLAAERGNTTLITAILKQQPDINARDKDGMTALMLAASRGSSESVNLLLKAGADPLLTDTFNKSARVYAEAASSNYNSRGYYDPYHSSGGGSSHSTAWILEEAEKSALQKDFEKTYDRMREKNHAAHAACQ